MHILIIEDQEGIASFLKQGLQEEGYAITIANNGQTGLDLALNIPYDLILLDWMLPNVTGLTICKTVRQNNKTTPILFLTAKDTVQETIEGLKAGANDYIKKPFSFQELLLRIQVHQPLSDSLNLAATMYSLGNITINTLTYQVFYNGIAVAMTQKEYDLLLYLIKNKGRVCTRNEIIENVWDIHFAYDTGVIDVFMNAIRKKLGLNKNQQIIKTVRGVGYIANEI